MDTSPHNPSNKENRSHGQPHQYDAPSTPANGSVRSDEGYHSNGYHDDFIIAPLEGGSSDTDSEKDFVLNLRYFIKKTTNLESF